MYDLASEVILWLILAGMDMQAETGYITETNLIEAMHTHSVAPVVLIFFAMLPLCMHISQNSLVLGHSFPWWLIGCMVFYVASSEILHIYMHEGKGMIVTHHGSFMCNLC